MEILVLGMPRTGTQSQRAALADALTVLGYGKIYHMREVGKNQHQNYWIAALEAKFEGKGDEYRRKEFDEFLSDYAGVADYPAAIFADELSKAYPEAKVILTVRDEDKWYESMMATIIHAYNKPNYQERSPMSKLANIYHAHLWGNDFPKNGRARFRENNEHVRMITPKENLLEYEVKDGWKPLCSFLGKQVPDLPFPRSDDWADYKRENGTGAGISTT